MAFLCVIVFIVYVGPTAGQNCSCGYKFPSASSRIAGGNETGVNEFPMMAFVSYYWLNANTWGGTIIDKRYVLTSAHTFTNGTNNLVVVVGEHNWRSVSENPPETKLYIVESIAIHPSFEYRVHDYDVAILRVNKDIEFGARVGPVCLPFNFTNFNFTGSTLTLLGWGATKYRGPRSNVLQKVDVTVISQGECQTSIDSQVTTRHICTKTPGKDACRGDSGGPALYKDPGTGLLFLSGIISYGRRCAQTGGVLTRVTAFLDWIEQYTPGANYCRK